MNGQIDFSTRTFPRGACMLTPDDEAWFAERPSREFRCRHLTDAERAPDDEAPPGTGLVRLAYVRRSDAAIVKVWTPSPDLLLNDEDEGRARFCAQGLPNPPPLSEPERHVEPREVDPATAAHLKAYLTGTKQVEQR